MYAPTPSIQISNVKGFGSKQHIIKDKVESNPPTQPDETSELIDHAQSLLEQAKVFGTKPVKRNKRHLKENTSDKPPKHHKKSTKDALDSLHTSTLDNLASLHVGIDGASKSIDESKPKTQKIKCKMCEKSFSSVRDLNIHHVEFWDEPS